MLAKPLANGDVSVALFNENGLDRDHHHHRGRDRQDRRVRVHADRPVVGRDLHHHRHDQRLGARPRHGDVPGRGRHQRRRRRHRPASCTRWARASAWTCRTRTTTAGTQVEIWDCNGGANQNWTHTSSGQLHRLLRQRPDVPGRLQQPDHARARRWRSGRATARPTSSGRLNSDGTDHRRPVRPVPGRDRSGRRRRHPRRAVDLQRRQQPAVGAGMSPRPASIRAPARPACRVAGPSARPLAASAAHHVCTVTEEVSMLELATDRRRRRWKAGLFCALAMTVAAFGDRRSPHPRGPVRPPSSIRRRTACGHVAAVRHLRRRRHAVRDGAQHHPGAVRRVQRAAVPDPALLRQRYRDIGVLAPAGTPTPRQVSFCAGTSCTITKIYDQTARHNDLPISWGGYWKGPGQRIRHRRGRHGAAGDRGGHQVYGVKVTPGVGYRIDHANGVPPAPSPRASTW